MIWWTFLRFSHFLLSREGIKALLLTASLSFSFFLSLTCAIFAETLSLWGCSCLQTKSNPLMAPRTTTFIAENRTGGVENARVHNAEESALCLPSVCWILAPKNRAKNTRRHGIASIILLILILTLLLLDSGCSGRLSCRRSERNREKKGKRSTSDHWLGRTDTDPAQTEWNPLTCVSLCPSGAQLDAIIA